MKKICFLLFCLLWLQNNIAQELSDSSNIMVVAHRGAHNHYPENSIPAIREAVNLGVDIVEIDIRHTKDSAFVLMHDKTIDRTTNGNGLIEDYTLDELKRFRLKNPDGSLSNEQIPTLKDVLKKFNGKTVFDIDIKTNRFIPVIEIIEKMDAVSSAIILVYDLEKASLLKKRNENFKILLYAKDEKSLKPIFSQLRPEAIHINDTYNTPSANQFIHSQGSRSFINSLGKIDSSAVHNPESFKNIYNNGANMIQTDYPELLLRFLRTQKLHK